MTVFFDIFQFLIILIAHALVGIYSSALKYKKKIIFFVWGVWVLMQLLLFCYVEFVLDLPLVKFLLGFLVAFVGQYLIYFLTTRGRVLQRLFTILTYSLFFCIMMSFYSMILGTFPQIPSLFRVVILGMMVMLLVSYFLRSVCPLCRNAGKNIKNAWYPLIFANFVFLSTVIASSVFPVRLIDFHAPGFVPFLLLSISIFSVYPVVFSCIRNASEVAMKKTLSCRMNFF